MFIKHNIILALHTPLNSYKHNFMKLYVIHETSIQLFKIHYLKCPV